MNALFPNLDFEHLQIEELFHVLLENIQAIEQTYFATTIESERNPNSLECLKLLSYGLQCTNPEIQSFLRETLNDGFIYNLLMNSIFPEEKYYSLIICHFMLQFNYIEDPKAFISFFSNIYYETTTIQTEIDIKIFHLIIVNLIYSFNAEVDVFDQPFFEHLSHFIHSSGYFDISLFSFMIELMVFIENKMEGLKPNPQILVFYSNVLNELDIYNDDIQKSLIFFFQQLNSSESFSIIWSNENIDGLLIGLWSEINKNNAKFIELAPSFAKFCSRSTDLARQMYLSTLIKVIELNTIELWTEPEQVQLVDALSSVLSFTISRLISHFDDELRHNQIQILQFCFRAIEIASFEIKNNLCTIISLVFQDVSQFFGPNFGEMVMENIKTIIDLFILFFPTAPEFTYLLLAAFHCFLTQMSNTEFNELLCQNSGFGAIFDELYALVDEMEEDQDIINMIKELESLYGFVEQG